jgi:hypothetical protein
MRVLKVPRHQDLYLYLPSYFTHFTQLIVMPHVIMRKATLHPQLRSMIVSLKSSSFRYHPENCRRYHSASKTCAHCTPSNSSSPGASRPTASPPCHKHRKTGKHVHGTEVMEQNIHGSRCEFKEIYLSHLG